MKTKSTLPGPRLSSGRLPTYLWLVCWEGRLQRWRARVETGTSLFKMDLASPAMGPHWLRLWVRLGTRQGGRRQLPQSPRLSVSQGWMDRKQGPLALFKPRLDCNFARVGEKMGLSSLLISEVLLGTSGFLLPTSEFQLSNIRPSFPTWVPPSTHFYEISIFFSWLFWSS